MIIRSLFPNPARGALVAILLALPGPGGHAAAQVQPLPDCALGAGHGGVFLVSTGFEVIATSETLAAYMVNAAQCAGNHLDDPQKAEFEERSRAIFGPPVERATARVALARGLSDDPLIVEQFFVATRLLAYAGRSEILAGVRGMDALARFAKAEDLQKRSGERWRELTALYHAQCASNQVPVPGPINSDPKWQEVPDISSDIAGFFIMSDAKIGKAWTYATAKGGHCVALLRQHDGTSEARLGVLCTNPKQTQACVFDNYVNDAKGEKARLDLEKTKELDWRDSVHPLQLENCTTCHLGANPFIVHPETILGKAIKALYPKDDGASDDKVPPYFEYTSFPDIEGDWTNLAKVKTESHEDGMDGRCMRCHELPRPVKNARYCATILQNALKKTMPPRYWGTVQHKLLKLWPDGDGCFSSELSDLQKYFTSVRLLKSYCGGTPVRTCNSE